MYLKPLQALYRENYIGKVPYLWIIRLFLKIKMCVQSFKWICFLKFEKHWGENTKVEILVCVNFIIFDRFFED